MNLTEARLGVVFAAAFTIGCMARVVPATELMALLRSEHARIASTDSPAPLSILEAPDVDVLAGMTHDQLLLGLGEPDECPRNDRGKCEGVGEWLYMFYKLPPGSRGGGAELHLLFGADQRCRSAEWQFTQ